MNVSVIILTFNEEKNLPRCLDALRWCDDIIVVDSGSSDLSVDIAKSYGARVFHRKFDNFSDQRNFGVSACNPKYEWVLHLDADEVITENFFSELSKLDPKQDVFAYQVPSKLMLFNQWLRYSSMYPVYQVRIGHRDKLQFVQHGHGQKENLSVSNIGLFPEPYLHFGFSHGLTAWLRKHAGYAEDEAKLIFSSYIGASVPLNTNSFGSHRWVKEASVKLPLVLRPVARFFYMLVVKRAFLDGRLGLLYVFMLSVYEAMISLHVMFLKIESPNSRK